MTVCFPTSITVHMNKKNLKLQGQKKLFYDLPKRVGTFVETETFHKLMIILYIFIA